MKRALKYYFGLIFVLLFMACHKYPKGGWTTNAIKHLAGSKYPFGKDWRVSKYIVNGIDSTDYVTGQVLSTSTVGLITFLRTVERKKEKCIAGRYNFNVELTENKSQLTFQKTNVGHCNSLSCGFDIFNPLKLDMELTIVWKIKKLTDDELVLSHKNENIYELSLISQ